MSEKPIREYDRFILRLPDGMRERLSVRAKANGRSMNAEIITMLSETLDPSAAELAELQRELNEVQRQRHDAAGVIEGIDRRMYALVDRIDDLKKALGVGAAEE